MKHIIILSLFLGSYLVGTSQQFSHGTVFPTGDILTSSGNAMSSGFILSYGTFATLNETTLASAITASSPFDASQFDSIFADYTQIGSTTFSATGDINTGTVTVAAGSEIYFWAFASTSLPSTSSSLSQLALYGPITIPALGSVPYTINSAVTNGDIFIGSSDASNNLLLASVTAVPEPSTYAAIFGALALGFVAYRRRRS